MMRGLFLDFDGTLADSLSVMQEAYHDFLHYFGRKGSSEEFQSLNGPPLQEVVLQLQKKHSLPISDIQELIATYKEKVMLAYLNVQAFEGVPEFLEFAKARQWKIAIVTSNSKPLVTAWLKKMNLFSFFDAVVTEDDVKRGKPFPDPYLHAIDLFQADPLQSIALEDSLLGSEAALKAGLPTYLFSPLQKQQHSPKLRGEVTSWSEFKRILQNV